MLRIDQATRKEDIRSVSPLFDEYRVFYGQPSNGDASFRFLYERWIACDSLLFFATEESRDVLGFVHLYPFFLSDRMLRFWVLNDLYVRPKVRRNGVGRALIRRAEQHARETGAAGLTLSTAVDNTKAQGLYESEGYVRDCNFLYYNRFFER
jgi:ribosomal protein S18 acetylase RimI-like enzyme